GSRLSVERAALVAMFEDACTVPRAKRCDAMENYRIAIVIERWVNVSFSHDSDIDTPYVGFIVCTSEMGRWNCSVGQE
ncbi:MAG TPA: hypothetical protein VM915_05530, partial [Verrucomicrobiae bacterium]|nr:hypothetical protein [Verrucomicrobiae bacterium]